MMIAVIPARGGSTRIPHKNAKLFAGKPIIAYSIEAAQRSGIFDRIVVSTDSEEIADIARQFGAEVPFRRPAELARNEASVAEVVHHTIKWIEDRGDNIESACCISACAPLMRSEFIVKGLELLQRFDVDTVMSVAKYPHTIYRAFKENGDGTISLIFREHEFTNSNDLPCAFHDASQFYWLNVRRFLETKSILGEKMRIMPVILPEYFVVDIDTLEDWERAELLYEVCKQKGLL
jgi:pseudaminic acid cytidylyltransferase